MKSSRGFFLALALFCLLLSACDPKTEEIPQLLEHASKVSCPYFDDEGTKHRCYRVRLPSISSDSSLNFDVPAVVFSQSDSKPSEEALIYIAGGPGVGGQTYAASLEYWAYWYQETGITDDLIIFNPRSLAGSSQTWHCDDFDKTSIAQLSEDLNYQQDIQRGFQQLQHCYAKLDQHLQAQKIDRRSFLKSVSAAGQAEDVNFIASALGYQYWHLWGASFGSRVAILAAAHPQVKSVVLDSVYPIEVGGLAEWADSLNASMTLWEDHYARSLSNGGGTFLDLLQRALTILETRPIKQTVSLSIEHDKGLNFSEQEREPNGGSNASIDFIVNKDRLKSIMFSSLYIEESVEFFIRGLQEIVDEPGGSGDYPQLQLAVEYFVNSAFDPTFNFILFWATECVDIRDNQKNKLQNILTKIYPKPFPNWREWVRIEAEADICANAFFDYRSDKYRYTQKPTLVFSGELDPVTPPHWGEIAHTNIVDSRHIVVENATHGILQSYYCNWGFWQTFLDAPDTEVSISCSIDY